MNCFDLLFPINRGPLTYICPDSLAGAVQPGLVVQAPLKNRLTRGIILRKNSSPPDTSLKEFQAIAGEPVILSPSLLKLLGWMSDYYIAPAGLVLKLTLAGELFKKTRPRKSRERTMHQSAIDFIPVDTEVVSEAVASIRNTAYKGFLLHSPSLLYEYSLAREMLTAGENIIMLLPDVGQANLLYGALKDSFADRLCLLHGELSHGKRSENMEGILSGRHDIVIGTRGALFAPLKNVSLIMVLNEHSPLYKLEEGIPYHLRDVAVMRGFMEKATVLLSSVSPSIDSFYNAMTGKYTLLKPSHARQRPNIRIINMRFEKKIRPDLSRSVYDAARRHISKNERVMFVVNRRGYSTVLLCKECGHIEQCHSCEVPLVHYKKEGTLKCHYCSSTRPLPETCSRCKGHTFELLGSGTQRVQEHVEELFGQAAMRFDSDTVRKKSEKEELSRLISGSFSRILIGTKLMTGRITPADFFSMAAVLNIDSSLNQPDFRAMEKAYQELSAIIDRVAPEGEVLVQTRFPDIPLFRHLQRNEYSSFAGEELSLRKSLGYPPYAKLLHIRLEGPSDLSEKIVKFLRRVNAKIEILGPITVRNKKGKEEQTIILKSGDRKALNTAAREVLQAFNNRKKIQVRVDVDPI